MRVLDGLDARSAGGVRLDGIPIALHPSILHLTEDERRNFSDGSQAPFGALSGGVKSAA
jgi:hypothetical protein